MSKKRKGMSLDTKQLTILGIYHEKLEPMNLKEIESLGAKAGVVQQAIKDVNQNLVDDFLVEMDKIGGSNIFWSFPSKVYKDREVLCSRLERDIATVDASVQSLSDAIEVARVSRSSSDRTENMATYEKLLEERKDLDTQLAEYKNNDPAEVKRVQDSANMCKDAANRWVDNIWAVKSYLVKKKGMASKEVRHIVHNLRCSHGAVL